MLSVDGADDVIGWFRFGKLGDSVDFDPNENCRVKCVTLFDAIELVRFTVRVTSESLSVKSLSCRSSCTSVIIGPDALSGCVFKLGIGGVCECVPGMTVSTLIMPAVALSDGKICDNDGLLFRAEIT